MKYRSRTEIVGLILEAANGGGATEDKNNVQSISIICSLREYLTMLQDNELIEYEGGRHTYRTTEKGMKLLELYENMSELVPPLAPTSRTAESPGSEEVTINESKKYNKNDTNCSNRGHISSIDR